MSLFDIKWIRRLIRRNTNPIPYSKAELWKRRLSLGYMVLAWNAFGLVCYMCFSGKADWAKHHGVTTGDEDLSPAQQYAKRLNVDKGKIIRFKGLTKTEELEFNNLVDEEE